MEEDMLSLSLRISCRFFVPKMFLRVVWAKSLDKYMRNSMMKDGALPGRMVCIFHIGDTNLEEILTDPNTYK